MATTRQDIAGKIRWDKPLPIVSHPAAVELPGDEGTYQTQGFRPGAQHYEHRPSTGDQKYVVVQDDYHMPQSNSIRTPPQQPAQPASTVSSPYDSPPSQQRYQTRTHLDNPYNSQSSTHDISPRRSHESQNRTSPPPIPPKTPIDSHAVPHQPNYPAPSPPADYGPRTL